MKSFLLYPKLLFPLLFVLLSINYLYAQETIGGPYTADDNTMLLLHFDGDLTNESQFSDDGIGHSNNLNGLTYLPSPLGTGMGQCLRLTNDALSDESYVTVADNLNLDLTGDWTIEGWINVFTFGTTSTDHRWVPRLCIKPGDVVFWRPNWYVELWGDARRFLTGYHTADEQNWPEVSSPNNIMAPGQWFHLTFIRDDTRKIMIQMVHNNQRELLYFGTGSYANLPVTTPLINDQDVHIGFGGWTGTTNKDSWLDGFVDEIRISNVVRNFPVPPIITEVTSLPNQRDDVPNYVVDANIMTFAPTGTITSAEIKYSIDGGTTWLTATMTNTSGNDYSGIIPQQTSGTIIKYYISATDDGGLTSMFPPQGPSNPFQFAIIKPNMLVLHLDFEEGTGTPIDKSLFQNPVTSFRPFQYSSDAKVGNYSFLMQSDAATNLDSSFLEVDSPFLTSLDFNVSFWFKADSIKQYIRIINRPLEYGNWWQNNYEIRTQNVATLLARYFVDPNAPGKTVDYIDLNVPQIIEINTWYKVLFTRDSTEAVFQLYDANNILLGEAVNDTNVSNNPPIQPSAPLRIGNGGNVGGARGFEGKIDEVLIYNNSEGINDPSGVDDDDLIPESFTLSQNFPNPFNPSTVIEYTVLNAQRVKIEVYDILGNKVKTLFDEDMYVGKHKVRWYGDNNNGRRVASGVYFYRLTSKDAVISRKLVFLK